MKNLLDLLIDKILIVVFLLFSSVLYSQIPYSNIELNNESFKKELKLFIDGIDKNYEKLFKTDKVISINIKKGKKDSELNIGVYYSFALNLNNNKKRFKGILNMDYKGAVIMIYSDDTYIENFYCEKRPVKFSEKQISNFVILYTINGLEIKYTASTSPIFDNSYIYELRDGVYKLTSKRY